MPCIFASFAVVTVTLLTIKLQHLSENHFVSSLIAANDNDQSSSRGKEQRKEIEQKHHTEWIKQCCSCCSFCISLLLCGLHVVQNVQKMKHVEVPSTPHTIEWFLEGQKRFVKLECIVISSQWSCQLTITSQKSCSLSFYKIVVIKAYRFLAIGLKIVVTLFAY